MKISRTLSEVFQFIDAKILCLVRAALGRITCLFFQKYTGSELRQCDVVLVLQAKYDKNGAFAVPPPFTTYALHNQKHTHIVYKQVATLEDVSKAIDDLKARSNRITGLWIRAHGAPMGMVLGKEDERYHVIHACTGTKLRPSFEGLEKDATILLESCSTGHIDASGMTSIAQRIASLAPGRKVFAPTRDINGFGTHFCWKNRRITATFSMSKRAGFLNILFGLLHAVSLGYYGDNVTCVHKHFSRNSPYQTQAAG